MRSISLIENWTLSELPLESGVDAAEKARLLSAQMHIPALPCDVTMALEAAGRIKDPLVGLNSFDCEWIENRSWWFRKVFTLTETDVSKYGVELFIESLDLNADILLNGSHIGHHENAFRPFVRDVRPWLKAGENELLIRLTTGVETVKADWADPIRDFVAAEYRSRRMGRGNELRTCLRKPQHVFGWDQSPHLATCAICGDVRLDLLPEIAVRDIRFETLSLTEAGAEILAEVEIDSRHKQYARDVVLDLALLLEGKTVYSERRDFTANAGHNYLKYHFTVREPALWWPNGYGEQPLYTVRVKAVNNYGAEDEKELRTGIRTVAMDTARLNEKERRYAFLINGKRIYAKGMDLIHSDAIHAKISDEGQRELLTAARDANFNMIRIWDGGWYESDYVHDLCDEYGILIFQTFCFACGTYPDHIGEFRRNVELEAAYQFKRLRSHPCMALWCGSGECHGITANFLNRHFEQEKDLAIFPGGLDIYGEILPRLHSQYVASVPYQCCSPFGGFDQQESDDRGECHFYPFLNLDPKLQQFRISTESFDGIRPKFIAECGVMGPPSLESLISACGGRENVILPSPDESVQRVTSLPMDEIRKMDFTPGGAETLAFSTADRPVGIFEHHRNTFERWAVVDGIYRHYTGERQLSVEEYCLLGGLFQGELLAYAADSIRISPECGGSLLWCLNDCFGEVGFSLMNHERTPKPAYYFLKRAYAPNRVILRREGNSVLVRCANDRPEAWSLTLQCGYAGFDGSYSETTEIRTELPAFAQETVIGSFPIGSGDLNRGVIYARSDDGETVLLRTCDFRDLEPERKAALTLSAFEAEGKDLSFTVRSDGFAHCVHFNLPADKTFSDLYFDLLPGESKRVTFFGGAGFDREKLIPDCVMRG